ncbi:MAG: hypothetical protein AAF802_22060 [Planctomycetota bacterium]
MLTLLRLSTATRSFLFGTVVLLASGGDFTTAVGQDGNSPEAQAEDELVLRQTGIAQRYQKLEELLLRLADVEAVENPERASLLRQAAKQSRDKFVLQQLRNAGDALRNEKFADAVNNQDSAGKGLVEILKLLTSEDRANRIRDEKKRIAEMIKDLKRVERLQRRTRARTENGSDLEQVEKEQEAIGDRSDRLRQKFKDEDPNAPEPSEDNPDVQSEDAERQDSESDDSSDRSQNKDAESKNGSDQADAKDSGEPSEPKQASENESPDSKSEDEPAESKEGSQSQDDAAQKSDQSQPSQQQGNSQQGESSQEESQSSPPQPKSPEQQAQDQLKQAIERMRQAQDDLEQSKRDEAIEQQLAAEENLRRAIDELEQILRQLREEEMQRELARLESRLKKMLEMQSRVLDETMELATTPTSQRSRQTDLRAGEISFEQKKITVEADRAMLLLREEGSSVAFPEVVAQIRDDSDRIAERLSKSQIDAITQGIQQDVLAAIEEMIQALQQAQRDLEKQKQQGQAQQGQPGQPDEQPLVGQISELKLIRTMETRIKKTTERYAELLQSDDSSAQDLLPLLKNLSNRQAKLYKITRDLVLKRNQ